ncbi:fumarate reductase flavoprotein subunit [Gammaproteobacteria bacterium]|nr:FAD-dependent oxidoreductase [Gammaproteobacteria bacterium]QOJ32175.1 MAG: FAD-dependent oxidoreductase [Gammaproteobacteria bacterium]CAG0946669.1 fumarate reductase flavoprotein subunit [Gammaproteobacteria bacterium]
MPAGRRLAALAIVTALAVTACQPADPVAADADVIVVGAGIAGLAAALEAESHGARVLVIEANSVAGGHAVRAGGFALVDTPLQRSRGYHDSPDIAYRDLMAWGEDADPWWVRFYVDNSREQVYDWLTAMGVKFTVVVPAPQASVPRFHFTRGAAVNAVVPMIREALARPRIEFLWNTEVTEILRRDGRIAGVRTERSRSGGRRLYHAPAVILATGGFQSNLDLVRRSWRRDLPAPARLLIGAGQYATGSGLRLVEPFGAALTRMDHQVTFVNGLPDPRDPGGGHGLLTQNPAAIWVDATGRRFTNEAASSKVTDRAVLRQSPATHWLVFDATGARQLTIRGAAWLSAKTIEEEILDNPTLVSRADDIAALAAAAGLPPDALVETVQRFNRFVDQGMDTDFGRIGPGMSEAPPPALRQPPYYAIQLFPMTRKSMGGLEIDHETRVLGGAGQVIRGLFAAGEATGVAGINGSHGGEGTFLGPSVLIGRVAGRSAVAQALGPQALGRRQAADAAPADASPAAVAPRAQPANLPALLAQQRRGYWHFGVSHALVVERGESCDSCHKSPWGTGPATTAAQRIVQLDSCVRCH